MLKLLQSLSSVIFSLGLEIKRFHSHLIFSSVVSDFVTSRTAACKASLPITSSQSLLKLTFIESVRNRIISSVLFPPPPAFNRPQHQGLRSQFFESDGQNTGTSASVLPMNIQDLFPLGLNGLIFLRRLSRVFSNTIVQKHQFFGAQLTL